MLLGWIGLVGCDVESESGSLLLVTVDTAHFCDDSGVESVQLVARWLQCASDDAQCEPPDAQRIEGDRLTCPATDAQRTLGVSLSGPGRYQVEAVVMHTADPPRAECYVDPQSGSTEVDLPDDRLQGSSPVALDELGPCP